MTSTLSRFAQFVRRRSRQFATRFEHRYYEWRGNELVIVYTLPKVGSSTVWHSLQAAHVPAPVYHVHLLSEQTEAQFHKALAAGDYVPDSDERLREVRRIRHQIRHQRKHSKVITLVREPVGRYISWFLQGWRNNFPGVIEPDAEGLDRHALAQLQGALLERRAKFLSASTSWFDSELKAVFGFDVFASEFPRERGYSIEKGNGADLLLIRLEDLNRCHQPAFREFMGIENLELVPTNVGSQKRYHALYHALLKHLTLPAALLDEMYSLPYVRHFYGPDEIARFRAKWEPSPKS